MTGNIQVTKTVDEKQFVIYNDKANRYAREYIESLIPSVG